MKSILMVGALYLMVTLLLPMSARAASWTQNTGGAYDWNVNATPPWDTGSYPNGADAIAYLTNILTGAQTVNLNQVTTLGTLVVGEPGNFGKSFTIAGNGGTINFQVSSGSALLAQNGGFGVNPTCHTIAAPIVLNNNLIVSNGVPTAGANQELLLSGNISENGGSKSVTYATASWSGFIVNGSNTYSGGTVLALGGDVPQVTVSNANALGSGSVTSASGKAGRLNFNLSAPATFSQNMQLAAGNGWTLYNTSANAVTLNGALSGGSGWGFQFSGASGNGGYVLGGNNSSPGSALWPDNTTVTILTSAAINGWTRVDLTESNGKTGKVYLADGVATIQTFNHHKFANLSTSTPVYLGMSQTGAASISGTVDMTGVNSATDTAVSDFYLDTPAGATLTLSGIIKSSSTYTTNRLVKIGAGTVTLGGNNTYSGPALISNGTLQVGAGGTSGTLGAGIVTNNGALVFNRSDTSYVVSNSIAGTGSLTQVGTGRTTLFTNNTYSGGTTLSNGALSISADSNLGVASGALAFGGGTLETTNSFALSVTRAISLYAGGGTFNVDALSTLTNGIAMSGAGALTKSGSGTLVLSGANLYSGGTTNSGGTISISADNNLGNTSGALVFGGGALETTNSFALSVTRAINLNAGGGMFNVDALSTLANGIAMAGVGGLTKSGAGTLVLSGANPYTGTTTINAGILQANVADGVGTGALGNGGNSTFTGGTLQYTGISAGSDYSGRLSNSTSAITLDTAGQNVAFTNTIAGSNTGGLTKNGGYNLVE